MTYYGDQLRDPRWQRRRLEIMSRANWRCEVCGDEKHTLHVHHLAYRRRAAPWEYFDDELRCLCERCHDREHTPSFENRLDALLWKAEHRGLNAEDKIELLACLQAYQFGT